MLDQPNKLQSVVMNQQHGQVCVCCMFLLLCVLVPGLLGVLPTRHALQRALPTSLLRPSSVCVHIVCTLMHAYNHRMYVHAVGLQHNFFNSS